MRDDCQHGITVQSRHSLHIELASKLPTLLSINFRAHRSRHYQNADRTKSHYSDQQWCALTLITLNGENNNTFVVSSHAVFAITFFFFHSASSSSSFDLAATRTGSKHILHWKWRKKQKKTWQGQHWEIMGECEISSRWRTCDCILAMIYSAPRWVPTFHNSPRRNGSSIISRISFNPRSDAFPFRPAYARDMFRKYRNIGFAKNVSVVFCVWIEFIIIFICMRKIAENIQ